MSIEREKINQARMPEYVFDQLISLPPDIIQDKTCKKVFYEVAAILMKNEVVFDTEKSSFRVKSREDIRKKSITRKSISPVRDIYGVRFIVSEADRFRVQNMIQPYFSLTPETFSDGRPSIREYADLKVRDQVRENYNPNITDSYSALHINIVFQREGANVYDIAEIQIMTKKELEASKNSRRKYTGG